MAQGYSQLKLCLWPKTNMCDALIMGFTILLTHPHPSTLTHTQSCPATPTHKNALNSHTHPHMSCRQSHQPIKIF